MENATFVRGAEGATDLADNIRGLPQVHAFGPDHGPQADTIHVLHDDVGLAIRELTRVEDAHDAGMIDAGQRFNLLPEFLDAVLVFRRVVAHHLDHYGSRDHLFIGGHIYFAESAVAQEALD